MLWRNQLWQWLEEGCRKLMLGVWAHMYVEQIAPHPTPLLKRFYLLNDDSKEKLGMCGARIKAI